MEFNIVHYVFWIIVPRFQAAIQSFMKFIALQCNELFKRHLCTTYISYITKILILWTTNYDSSENQKKIKNLKIKKNQKF